MKNSTSTTRRVSRRAFLGGSLGAALAIGGTSAWALDRFVIDDVQVADAASYEASQGATSVTSSGGSYSSDGYTSDTTKIAIEHYEESGVSGYLATITLTDAKVLRSAFAQNKFGQNITEVPSAIASDNNAVLAINGDYYGFRSTGIVIRNGVIYRDKGARQGLVINTDGTMKLYDETATSAKELLANGAWQTLSFGPGLVSGGKVMDGIDQVEVDTNVGNHSIQGDQPRTAVGLIDTDTFLFAVIDGRSSESEGLSMSGIAQLMADKGCQVAYNIDGGGSSTMVFDGSVINDPLGKGQERGTSDILYIAG